MQVGDRVTTYLNQTGTIVGIAPLYAYPLEWMVLVDGDSKANPYLDQEILLIEEDNE